MFESIFGPGWSTPVQFLVAFVIVLALIGATFWLIRRFGGTTLGATATRGRQPRLAVIDAAAVDARRRLVLIRRDNVEHLVMIGGPSDVVIEQNIVRAVPVAPQREAPGRSQADVTPRSMVPVDDYEPAAREIAPRPDFARTEPPRPEPVGRDAAPREVAPREVAPRPDYTPRADVPSRLDLPPRPESAPRLQPDMVPRPQPEFRPLPEPPRLEPEITRAEPPPRPPVEAPPRPLRPELPVRPPRSAEREPPMPRAPEPPRPEPALARAPEPLVARATEPRVPVPPEAPVARPLTETMAAPIVPAAEPDERAVDANLASMAQRLEAALRRPFVPAPAEPPEPRFAAPEPRAPLRLEPIVDDEPELSAPVAAEAPRAETRAEPPRETPRTEPRAEARPGRAEQARQRSVLDSLEEEMASLLGRPPGKE